jgi:hypothetical protein
VRQLKPTLVPNSRSLSSGIFLLLQGTLLPIKKGVRLPVLLNVHYHKILLTRLLGADIGVEGARADPRTIAQKH